MRSLQETTQILADASRGDRSAADRLLPMVYDELRALAGSYLHAERPGHTLQPTALVHEAYLRLVDETSVDWNGRTHFFALAARAMRRILVDEARKRHSVKRGGDLKRITFSAEGTPAEAQLVDVLALEEALTRLGALDERANRVVELRFFAGLRVEETAHVLGVSARTVEADWRMARAWLSRQLTKGDAS